MRSCWVEKQCYLDTWIMYTTLNKRVFDDVVANENFFATSVSVSVPSRQLLLPRTVAPPGTLSRWFPPFEIYSARQRIRNL